MSTCSADGTGLLVSVRSAAEAIAALAGGAALIDVKEPDHGPLGRAPDAVIAEVVAMVAGRRPVSAALGELLDDRGETLPAGLSFVKWGLAGAASTPWGTALEGRCGCGPAVVAVAYADWQCARAPSIDRVFAFAVERPGSVMLVDTHCKDVPTRGGRRPTLLDWLGIGEVVSLCAECRAAGVRIALAGSLGLTEIRLLSDARPDWFAVRGSVCNGGRGGCVDAAMVRELAGIIRRCGD
jgi:(5-formylfuran-3-yl)methyl phosphate synthase